MIREQDGVVSRRQALAAGLADHDIRRLLRRNEWARVHDGVYVDHTGPLTWLQRAWAAVLYAAPAALCLESALGDESVPIQVAIARERSKPVAPVGVRIHQMAHFEQRILANLSPPRQRYEEAVLDVASRSSRDSDAVAVLANACQSRRTTAARLLRALDSRRRISRRRWLRAILVDVSDGACSVLEQAYIARVERAHGLPPADRQQRSTASGQVRYRDAEYRQRLIVELDGRLFHDSVAARNRDYERDLDAALEGRSTVRLSYQQVVAQPCRTAAKIAGLMRLRGLTVSGHPCGPGCEFPQLDAAA